MAVQPKFGRIWLDGLYRYSTLFIRLGLWTIFGFPDCGFIRTADTGR